MSEPQLSIVVPVYGCANMLAELSDRIDTSVSKIVSTYEIVFVDDGSLDDAWKAICEISNYNGSVVGLRLSRNFGQQAAIFAGLSVCKGDWVVVMDCDLQDLPEEIPNLFNKAQEGYEQVVAIRKNRQDSWIKNISSRIYLEILSRLLDRKIEHTVHNFGIYSRRVIKNISELNEQGKTFGLLLLWVGFSRFEMNVEHGRRHRGKSSYSFRALIKLAFSGIIIYSDKPLRLLIKLGALITLFSLLGGLWILIRQIVWSESPAGWTSIVTTILLSTGIIIGSIGILGTYIGKIFSEAKSRPTYVIWQSTFDQ
jgi:glycosyltransferase involved in cell wall biosynthesis